MKIPSGRFEVTKIATKNEIEKRRYNLQKNIIVNQFYTSEKRCISQLHCNKEHSKIVDKEQVDPKVV
jgi:hypothetical protein